MDAGYKEVRERPKFFGKICRFLFWGLQALMAYWLLRYWTDVAQRIDASPTGHASFGTEIGVTLATGTIAFFWVAGSVVFGLLVLFTRGAKMLVPLHEAVQTETVATPPQASPSIPEHDIAESAAPSPLNKKTVIAFVLLILCGVALAKVIDFVSGEYSETFTISAGQTPAVPPVFDFAATKQAAERGDVDAQNKLGAMYFEGNGAPLDYGEALIWFQKSAAQGYAKAQYNLGQMYRQGKGLPQDLGKAIAWYQKSADQGYAPAQANLGVDYHTGQGVPQDDVEAVKWWRKAAEQDYAKAEVRLGVAYHEGMGVPKDGAEAAKWWRRAADQNDAEAQFFLGGMYYEGDAVTKDTAEAVNWLQKAAGQGHVAAQDILGMIQKAEGVKENPHENTPINNQTAAQPIGRWKLRYMQCLSDHVAAEPSKWNYSYEFLATYFNSKCEDEMNAYLRFDEECKNDIDTCLSWTSLLPVTAVGVAAQDHSQ